jgi:hypothetical protein
MASFASVFSLAYIGVEPRLKRTASALVRIRFGRKIIDNLNK